MISIRCGSGLGDALYLQSVARHLIGQGHTVEACCDWPDVFRPVGNHVKVSSFRRTNIDRVAHYAPRRRERTTQWEDVCIGAGISPAAEQRLDWRVVNTGMVGEITVRAVGRPIVAVQMPRPPFARSDGYGVELLPDCRVIQRAIDRVAERAFVVQLGAGEPLLRFRNVELDLANETTVSELLDVASVADAFVGFVSYFVPLAESLSKPALFVWSRCGLASRHDPVRRITPQKVLHRKDLCQAVFDDCSGAELDRAVDAICESIGRRAAA